MIGYVMKEKYPFLKIGKSYHGKFKCFENIIDIFRGYNGGNFPKILEVRLNNVWLVGANEVEAELTPIRQLTPEDIEEISSGKIRFEKDKVSYIEFGWNDWKKFTYDEDGNLVRYEDTYGIWEEYRYHNGQTMYRNSYNPQWRTI